MTKVVLLIIVGFNPHTHAGCDIVIDGTDVTDDGFNPHTHAGCDLPTL